MDQFYGKTREGRACRSSGAGAAAVEAQALAEQAQGGPLVRLRRSVRTTVGLDRPEWQPWAQRIDPGMGRMWGWIASVSEAAALARYSQRMKYGQHPIVRALVLSAGILGSLMSRPFRGWNISEVEPSETDQNGPLYRGVSPTWDRPLPAWHPARQRAQHPHLEDQAP
jgi:hypothetical protein